MKETLRNVPQSKLEKSEKNSEVGLNQLKEGDLHNKPPEKDDQTAL